MSRRQRLSPQEAADRKFSRRMERLFRDQTIYDEVVVWKHRQIDVAAKLGLTQARVSQIVARMSRLKAEQAQELGQPLGQPSPRLVEQQAHRSRLEELVPVLRRQLHAADAPLKTVKTRKDGEGNIVFVEETVREVKPNMQVVKVLLSASRELVELSSVPPLSPEDEAAAIERGRKLTRLQEETEIEDLETKAAAQAEVRKGREELKEAQMRAEMGNPKWDEDLSTPERWGYYFARKRLEEVADGRLSLADAEVMNQHASRSNEAVYPSYFEICDENINGVRVAKWVRDLVPQPSLPTDDEAFLPCCHNLKEWDPHVPRVIEPYPSKLLLEGQNPHRFGRLEEEDVGWVERAAGDSPGDSGPPASDDPRGAGVDPAWVGARDDGSSPRNTGGASLTHPTPEESLDVQEERALNDLRRLLYGRGLWAEMADNNVRQLLAEGKSNLYYQGYTREQYQAFEAWHRVRQRRKEEERARESASA